MWLYIVAGIVVLVGFVAFTGAPYVPSRRRDVQRLFSELLPLSKQDVVVDIGSGDGVVLRQVSKLGARAVGYEIHPVLVLVSWLLSRGDRRVRVKPANFWRTPLPDDVTIVYTLEMTVILPKMYNRVQTEATRLSREIIFVSYAFTIPGVQRYKFDKSYNLYKVQPLQES